MTKLTFEEVKQKIILSGELTRLICQTAEKNAVTHHDQKYPHAGLDVAFEKIVRQTLPPDFEHYEMSEDAVEYRANEFLRITQVCHNAMAAIRKKMDDLQWGQIGEALDSISGLDLREEALWKAAHKAYQQFGGNLMWEDPDESSDYLAGLIRPILSASTANLSGKDGSLEKAADFVKYRLDLCINGLRNLIEAVKEFSDGIKEKPASGRSPRDGG